MLHGRVLSDEELADIRMQVEGFATIGYIDAEMRAVIEEHLPDLAARLPPRRDDDGAALVIEG
jgi:hypothetical protein